ncbi:MAG: F510_1955 family glycosylhydrolase [Burkholderiaceae bacterium]
MKKRFSAALLGIVFIGIAVAASARAGDAITLTHVHGLSYSADGARIMVPSHHGIAVFEDGRWTQAGGPAHDYMGYSATGDALYSSGHPAPGTGLTNPFGLIKSSDGGKSWKKLGLEGEADFHTLATSYATNAVYVVNHGPNSRMSQPGIYFTRDDGLKWNRAAASGLSGELASLAVHPRDAAIVAAGTANGLYLSRDAGQSFERLFGGQRVLAEFFDLDGKQLWFSSYAGKASLMRIALEPGAKPVNVSLPALNEDAVAYIAQNPKRRNEWAIATFKRNVFVSKDAGAIWTAIARDGSTRE